MKTFFMRSMVIVPLFLGAVAIAAEPAIPPKESPLAALPVEGDGKLEGTYKITASEKSGEPTPPETIDGVIVVFTATKLSQPTATKRKSIRRPTRSTQPSCRPSSVWSARCRKRKESRPRG